MIRVSDIYGEPGPDFYLNDAITIKLGVEVFEKITDVLMDIQISTPDGIVITHSMNILDNAGYFSFEPGYHEILIELDNIFQPGNYTASIGIHKSSYGTPTIDYIENIVKFNIRKLSRAGNGSDYKLDFIYGYIRPKASWKLQKN